MKFRKKPVVIEAIQYNEPKDAARMWQVWGSDFEEYSAIWEMLPNSSQDALVGITTLEGDHKVIPGDWIIKGVAGEFYPCKNDIFWRTYEAVSETKEGV